MIEITDLTKKYGNKTVVDHINFRVEKGEIVGFLGPNGAGKSTTMNILTGYTAATSGSCKVDGFDILEEPLEVKKRIGYLPEQPPLYLDMKVKEYLDFVFELKKAEGKKDEEVSKVMKLAHVDDVAGRLIKNLSKGYRQRVGLAQALIGNPEVLILDEPTVGLDPKQILEIRSVIKELGKEHTIILSSHILSEVSAICERVIIIGGGKILAVDTPENLSKRISGENRYSIVALGAKADVRSALQTVAGVTNVQIHAAKEEGAYQYLVETKTGTDLRAEISGALAKAQLPILRFESAAMSLEDIFLQLTEENKVLKDEKPEAAKAEEVTEAPASETLEVTEEKEVGTDDSNL